MTVLVLQDDAGRSVLLSKGPAQRVVSLTPEVAENLFAIGAGRYVVGVTTADDYPPAVRALPKVGAFGQPDYERIRSLRPDVVIAASATIPPGEADLLQRRLGGIPVFQQRSSSYDDVPRHLVQLGELTGALAGARREARAVVDAATTVARRVNGLPRPTVFVQISAQPLYAAGPGSFVDDLVRRAGGRNAIGGKNPFPQISKEALLAADPDQIILPVTAGQPVEAVGGFPLALTARLRAVRRGTVHLIPSDLLFRPTPRLAHGLVLLAQAVHPEAFRR
jgi:iron complex transport system substrate-binding protein